MTLKSPLRIGAVEVTSINEDVKSICLMVHVNARPEDIKTLQVQSWIGTQLHSACKYLVDEGFIAEPLDSWLTHIAAILHTP